MRVSSLHPRACTARWFWLLLCLQLNPTVFMWHHWIFIKLLKWMFLKIAIKMKNVCKHGRTSFIQVGCTLRSKSYYINSQGAFSENEHPSLRFHSINVFCFSLITYSVFAIYAILWLDDIVFVHLLSFNKTCWQQKP